MWHDDLVSILTSAGVGSLGTSIFIGPAANIPSGNGPYIVLTMTGGTNPEWIQNVLGPAYVHPGAQIVVLATNFDTAMTKALAAYAALTVVRNQSVGGKNYVSIVPLNEPFPMADDSMQRTKIAFNILGTVGTQ